ncbi:MAG: Gfo/Idh/MocA family oxidoreductase [Sphaerochaetaceae bacterium]|nr:Gfo/Idh/MocA family oxidoreductase [Sphaerochaetaceae bacterium]
MEKKVGFGIIGLGVIADTHAIALSHGRNCFLAGAFDVVPGKAESFCRKYGGTPYDKLDVFLADPRIEAVCITTPSGYHLDPVLAAMRAGKHALVEKPLEITAERCDEIINAAKHAGVKLSGIFQSRFHDAPRLIKKAIEDGKFGTIVLADAQIKWFRTQEYYDSGAWRGTWKVDGGGVLMNQSIHAIDLLQWFMGEVKEVSAFTSTSAHERIEVEDTGAAVLKFANGAIGVIEGTTGAYPGTLKKIEICGSKGSALLEEESLKVWKFVDETDEDERIRAEFLEATSSGGGASDPRAINTHGHERQFEDFADAILHDRAPFITGEDAKKSVEIIRAIYESAQSKQLVRL